MMGAIKNKLSILRLAAGAIILLGVFIFSKNVAAAVPHIFSYQGRLYDNQNNLLGGAGAAYYFKFSIWDNAAIGSGNKLWPAGAPSAVSSTVEYGVFNVLIGDTSAGGDPLTLDFNNENYYLQIEAASQPDFSDGETLSPRQRIAASGFAINAETLNSHRAAESASGAEIPVLTNGNLNLGGANPQINATSAYSLTLQGGGGAGSIYFFNSSNGISSDGNLNLGGAITMGAGATTTIISSSNIIVGGKSVCFSDGTNCPAGGGSLWTDSGAVTYLTSAGDNLALGGIDLSAPFFFDAASQLLILTNATTGNSFEVRDEIGDSSPFVIDAFGRVGLGTSAPETTLDVWGNIWSTKSGDASYIKAKGTGNMYDFSVVELWSDAATDKYWALHHRKKTGKVNYFAIEEFNGSSYQDRVVIKPGGNVGIGVDDPTRILTIAKYSATDPIADAWNVYSTSEGKEIIREINPHGFLDAVIGNRIFEYKKRADASDDFNKLLESKIENEWAAAAESADLAENWDDWLKARRQELENSEWAAAVKEELFNQKSQLLKFSQHLIGMLADDPTTPTSTLTFDENGKVEGINLAGYMGYLHAALKEAGMRIKILEEKVFKIEEQENKKTKELKNGEDDDDNNDNKKSPAEEIGALLQIELEETEDAAISVPIDILTLASSTPNEDDYNSSDNNNNNDDGYKQ